MLVISQEQWRAFGRIGGERNGARQMAKTHCPEGHPYDEANTYHNPRGYGTINVRINGIHQGRSAHRTSYEEFIGPIPEGMALDHKCSVRECIHPNHLEPVPQAENIRRRDERRRAA